MRANVRVVAAAAVFSSATFAASAIDNHVLSLTGVGQYAIVPHSASLAASDELTVEYWVRVDNTSGFGRIGKTAASHGQWGLGVTASGVTDFWVHGTGGAGPTTHPLGQWCHLAGTWKRSTGEGRLYVNGELKITSNGSSNPMNSVAYPVLIGMQPGYSESQLYGAVDNFRVWTVARTQAQLQTLMHHQVSALDVSAHQGLVLSLSFESGSDDASPFGNHATLMGGGSVVVDNSFLNMPDCNEDGVVDSGQILSGQLSDSNGDGIPNICQCPGDVTGNDIVDGVDLAAILGAWGTNGQNQYDCDIDGDGIVGGTDLAYVLSGWGPCQ